MSTVLYAPAVAFAASKRGIVSSSAFSSCAPEKALLYYCHSSAIEQTVHELDLLRGRPPLDRAIAPTAASLPATVPRGSRYMPRGRRYCHVAAVGPPWTPFEPRLRHYVFMYLPPSFLRSWGGAVTCISESTHRRHATSLTIFVHVCCRRRGVE